MNLRLPIAILLVAGCFVLSVDTCSAQRHPSRIRKNVQTPPTPTNPRVASKIRLVQAMDDLDNDLGDVLDSARDLLEKLDDDSSAGDLQLDSPKPVEGATEAPKLPRTLDEYRKQRQKDALDDLRDSTDESDDLDLDSLTGDDEDDQETEDTSLDNRYQDVVRRPPPRRRSRANMPATLGAILDDDEIDPACEQEFCRIMWQCAGGRCLSWCDRMKRNHARDMLIKNSCANPGCVTAPFREPFVCPKVQQYAGYNQCPTEQYSDPCPPATGGDPMMSPVYDDGYDQQYQPTLDEFQVAPPVLESGGDALQLTPVPDNSISRKVRDSDYR
jgi:hypothetical protein